MADTRISDLTALAVTPASNDLVALVDVSDASMAPSGTTKKITFGNLIGVDIKETPSGSHNGVNVTYTLTHTPIANTFDLVVQGQVFTETTDYSFSGTTLTLVTALPAGFTGTFIAKYRYAS